MSEASDDELIVLAKKGDRQGIAAYEVLVRRHQGRVIRLATYLLGGDADANDIAQEAFLRAHASLARFQEGTSFSAWVRTITTRLCFNLRRDLRARTAREQIDGDVMERVPSSTRTAVEWTLGQLSYPYREVLLLRFVEEMSLEEIAATLDIGVSAAKMRLARARQSFFDVYEREHKTPVPPVPGLTTDADP